MAEPEDNPDAMETSDNMDLLPVSTQEALSQTLQDFHNSADDGVIEKLVLKNFMCHQHFQMEFDPNVNFIIGQNGSGKSAIMTAITTCLGGKASVTNRAHNLSTFVRSGANEAELSLTLRNRGDEAYKPEEYGRSITVIRIIKKDGGGIYKLKGALGKAAAQTTKEEIIKILDHFNIQVDNPVSMLGQDTSRNFLHSQSSKDKYKLFMKGTHLDQIAHDYASAEEQQKLMKEEIKREMSMMEIIKQEAKKLEEEVQEMDRLDNLEDKLENLSLELSWAVVKSSENKAKEAQKAVKDEEKKVKRIEEKLERCNSAKAAKQEERDTVTSELEAINNEVNAVDKEREELDEKKRGIVRILNEKKSEGRSINSEIQKLKNEKKAFEDKLNECKSQNPQDLEGERRVLDERKTELEKELAPKQSRIDSAKKDKYEKELELKKNDENLAQSRREVTHLRHQIEDCRETLNRLESARQDSLQVFGPWMTEVCRAIERQKHRFKKTPKGPVGSHVKVRDQNWVRAIEVAIGFGNLIGFVVDNQEDGDTLRNIIKQTLGSYRGGRGKPPPHPPVITSRFEGRVYNVQHNMPHCSYPTIHSMIEVADPDILNMLIDMCGVETSILIEDKTEARDVMSSRPPMNARNAYSIEGDQVQPNHRYYSNKQSRPMGILQTSVTEGIRQQKRSLEDLERALGGANTNNDQVEGIVLKLKRDRCKIDDFINRERQAVRKLENHIEELKMQLEEIDAADQGQEDIATWEGIIQDLEGKLADKREQLSKIKDEMQANNDLYKEHDILLVAHDEKVKAVATRLQHTRVKMKTIQDEIEKINRTRFSFNDRLTTSTTNLNQLQQNARKLEETAAEQIRQVSDLGGERIETNRSVNSIQTEIVQIEKKLNAEANRRANQDEVKRKYLEKMELFEQIEKKICQHRDSFHRLKESLEMRVFGFGVMRMRITNRARLYFQSFVSKRGYSGTLDFDTTSQKLEIIVKINKNQATNNVSALSGGERSFSTVSFIMALWEAIESPFRCLDEFDVFMDLMNRKISMSLMLEGAKTQKQKQFIFFTPQDMSALGIKLGGYKVLQLQAPDRSQRTLNMSS